MTSRRRVETAVATATGKSIRRGLLGRKPWQVTLGGDCRGTVPRSLEGMGLRGSVHPAPCATAPQGMAPRLSSPLDGPPLGTSP